MDYQFLRKWSLYLAEKGGDALDLSRLKCAFVATKKDTETPNEARLLITNLSKTQEDALKKTFTRIIVNAGYSANFGVIFDGNIKSFTSRKEGTETILEVLAGDGDKQYNYSVINRTLAAGASPDSIIKEASEAMGLPVGYKSELQQTTLPRGKVLYGRPYEYLREQAQTQGCTWSIQDGEILMLKRTELKKGEAVLLTSKTGLIGVPAKSEEGVKGRCLLNPKLKIGAAIKLQSKIAPELDGEYRLISVSHRGDTHGQDWYTDFTALSLNPSGGKDKVDKK